VARQSAPYKVALHFIQRHLLKPRRSRGRLRSQAKIRGANERPGRKQHATLDCVVQFTHVARPKMFMQRGSGGGVKAGYIFAITLRISLNKVVRQQVNVFATLS
jgi:hypothetical protein